MGFFNQYSFLIFSGIGGIALALMLWRWTRPPVALRATVLLFYAIGIIAFTLVMRYPAVEVSSVEQVETTLSNGRPTFMMFYSNYCVSCLAALPAVRDIQTQLVERDINVLLLNIHERPGSELLGRFGFEVSPTYLVFDAGGQEILRGSTLPTLAEIEARISAG